MYTVIFDEIHGDERCQVIVVERSTVVDAWSLDFDAQVHAVP